MRSDGAGRLWVERGGGKGEDKDMSEERREERVGELGGRRGEV